MRNCLPKIFRTKSSSTRAAASVANSNESDADSDAERYVIAKTTTTNATRKKFPTASDQVLDNGNKKQQQQQQQQQQQRRPAKATTKTTRTTAITAKKSLPDDVDKSRLISAVSTANSNGLDLKQSDSTTSSSSSSGSGSGIIQTATNGSILASEMKVVGGEISLPVPVPVTQLTGNSSSKTPEQMELEYEANVAAEGRDIMTPLLRNTRSLNMAFGGGGIGGSVAPGPGGGVGRILQPEIVEAIRNLDTQALRLNNLTLEDRIRLTQQQQQQQQQQQPDDGDDCVVLRPKVFTFDRQCHSLYERRLHKGPKLRLWVGSGKKPATQSDEDEFKTFQRNLMDLKYPTVLPPNPQLKALLVFHKSDSICEVITLACQRHQLDVTLVKSKEEALETLHKSYATAQCYHLIIIDARSTKGLDAEHIARAIRHTHGHHLTTIITVCKKSFFEKDDALIALLDAGVNRCIAETTNLAMCSVEMKQILHSIIRPHNVMSTQQALYTALHRLKEVVLITDDVYRIQYANRATERLLNMRLDEIISKPLADIFHTDLSIISEQGRSIKEFDGILTVRRKGLQDGIPMHVRVVPVACIGSAPTHLIFNFDVPGGGLDFIATLPQPKEAPRGSLHSVRRCSFDVRSIASDGLRRTSLAKLTSLPLEAPITKENCSADEARLIDKVLEFLKREGLYSPQMKEIRTDDPTATDLIGALLTGPSVYSSRRSSNDSIIRTGNSTRTATIVPAKMKANPIIMELLEESLSWDFDIFKLEEITDYHPLLYLGMEIFRRFDVFATLNIDENVCKAWLAVIEAHYHKSNTYHNSTHAADVMQATGAFITQLINKDMVMDRMDQATALIAAAAHDVDHPGRSSQFLCNSNNPLAVLYNDLTVLESHHAAITFKLTLGDDKINIFKNLDKETYKSARSTIIDMILATEMTRHFEHLAKFVSVFGSEVEPRELVQSEEETSILMRRMLIKVADVSNPARPMQYCIEWARRIAEEYFMQTDEEKQRHLPIVMPMFDRATCSIPKSQIGFIEYIIQDMMEAWDSFIDMPQLITCMKINYSQWKKYDEQGVNTLADIMAKQPPVGNNKPSNSK
ncbi:high affinity cAMP-specific and IBMX-insensitive 3',5'-cyclic phosphodiesterase 8 isoform X2 [Drosophila grimshawi]|uniref:high affinity cAMP-specific and IBMX-insensitive 3',5'-cyclic phosphodiesterase 8 isoform X2 n=1 Tax=Drosophila grimshawi TaxID=7222 RepID=UPI0013EF2B39|nr:high affinity cAMP-specific and IBMX-insensitive 3',5'-cyclic phosphodiesterase 8 isoform X2 [Drosophila grimshawi]